MKVLSNDLNNIVIRMGSGLVRTILFIVVYKTALPFIVPFTGDFVYTLILLITPAVLYITFRKLVIDHWKYRLPFVTMFLSGTSATVLAGIGIGLVDYIVMSNGLPLFGEIGDEPVTVSVWTFLYGYITWYFFMGIITVPVLYCILWFQLKRKKANV